MQGLALEPLPLTWASGGARPRCISAPILTGDSFVNSEDHRQRLHGEFAAQAVEMEGGAVAQVARRWGSDIPFVNVRCLSDSPARAAISISAPSCRSPRATPRRSPTVWRR